MPKDPESQYRRILLKLSGEMLLGDQSYGMNAQACQELAQAIKSLKETGVELGIVMGGGNIFRGVNAASIGIARTPADQIGMLATLMNGLALQQSLESLGCPAIMLTALECPKVAESYTWRAAHDYLSKGHVVIFVGGTGNPYFTTDTAAALRASEIHANILLKATKVDGIYTKDPLKFSDAKKYETISYSQVLAEKLAVMDATSIALCRSNNIPILVFNMLLLKSNNAADLLKKQRSTGTLVSGE